MLCYRKDGRKGTKHSTAQDQHPERTSAFCNALTYLNTDKFQAGKGSGKAGGSCSALKQCELRRAYRLSISHWKEETQLSLTNRATHLCKYNDVADLTSVIKIRLKFSWFLATGLSRSLKVTGTDTDRSNIYTFLSVLCSNFVPKSF